MALAVPLALLLLLLSAVTQAEGQQVEPASEPTTPCGAHNQRACPAEPPEKPYPSCTEPDAYALYPSGYGGAITDDFLRSLEGWCWRIDPQCGTAPGKPCCPNGYRQGSNPDLPNVSCNDNMTLHHDVGEDPQSLLYCQVDPTHPASMMYDAGNSGVSYRAGTCVSNAPDCGQTGRSCCYWESGCCASPVCFDAQALCELPEAEPPGTCVVRAGPAASQASTGDVGSTDSAASGSNSSFRTPSG